MRTLHAPFPLPPLPVHLYPLLLLLLLATSTQCAVKIIMAANCAISAHPHPVPAPALAPAPLASVFRVIPHPPCNAFCLPEKGRGGGEKEGEQQHIGAALSSNVQFCCSCHAPLSRGETLVNVLATCCGNCTRTQLEAPMGEDIISIYRHRHR